MKKNIELDKSKKVFPIITLVIGIAIMLVQLITRQNLIAIVSAGYCIVMSAVIVLSLIIKKKIYLPMVLGYAAAGSIKSGRVPLDYMFYQREQ